MITTKDDTLAWLQSHRSEAKRIIEQWEEAPDTASDAPKAARRDLQIIDGLLMRLSKNAATEANGKTVEPLSRDEELSYTLSLAAQLEAEKAARLAAVLALDRLKTYATETYILWDKDQDSKVGKRLLWMSGAGNEGYEPDLNWIHKPDPTAAQETLRKAAECGRLYQYLGFLATLAPKFDCAFPVDEAWVKRLHAAIEERINCDTLRTERDGLLAMVEAKQRALKLTQEAILEQTNDWPYDLRWKQVCDASNLTPADALAALREEIRQQTLEEAAKYFDDCWSRVAAELRRMAEKEGK
jgi:hypothetical protein